MYRHTHTHTGMAVHHTCVCITCSGCNILHCASAFTISGTIGLQQASKQCRPSAAFSLKGQWLGVHTFPALFKMPKTESDCGSKKELSIVFLDRNVDISNGTLLLNAAFCSIVYSVFFTSTIVFLRYFPVEESEECLEKDSHGQSLFCYSNSSLPVDCAEYSVTELRELHFQCYIRLNYTKWSWNSSCSWACSR